MESTAQRHTVILAHRTHIAVRACINIGQINTFVFQHLNLQLGKISPNIIYIYSKNCNTDFELMKYY